MSKVICNREDIVAIADAVRNKLNSNDGLTLGGIVSGIESIEVIDTTDATATASDIFDGKTAYANGEKVTGTFTIEEELTEQNDLIAQIATLVATKANPQGGGNSGENKLAQYVSGDLTEITAEDLKGATTIAEDIFYYVDTITKVELPDTITSIGNSAFLRCANLTDVVLPNSITSIGEKAFYQCLALESVIVPPVQSIGNNAFDSCKALKNATLSDGCAMVAQNMFRDCTLLEQVILPESITKIKGYAFYNCTSLKNIVIPSSAVFSGANNIFDGCISLESVVIGENNSSSIHNYMFIRCSALKNIVIPDKIGSVGQGAFQDCTSLESITIGEGVTSIYFKAFYGCSSLKKVTLKRRNSTVSMISSDAFSGVPEDCEFYVYADMVEKYKAATNWSARADYIFPIEEE